MFEGSGGQYGRCGTDQGSQVHCDPVGKPPAALDVVGALLKAAEGPGKLRDPRSLPVAGGYFWTGVFFFLRPLPFVVDTNVCVFADHLICTLHAQLLKLSSHITRFSRREASSKQYLACMW